MRKILFTIAGVLLGASGLSEASIKAGAAKVDITPTTRAYIAGYGMGRSSTGVHDPIWARCLVLEVDGRRVALLSLDLIGLFLDEVDVIRKGAASDQLRPEDIIVSCTHNHEGPDTLGLWGQEVGVSGVDPGYIVLLRKNAIDCIRQANDNLVEARLRIGQTTVMGVSRNGRDPGLLDPTLVAIRAENAEGGTIAALVNFANHPEALGSKNTLISCDWPNYLYSTVEGILGGICLFQNGALGGMVTPDVAANTFEEAERIGSTTAIEAVNCLKSAPVMMCTNLSHLIATVEIPVANRNFLALKKAGVIMRSFRQGKVRTELHLLRLGGVEMVTIPGEALPKVGLAIKSLMAAKYKILVGLANDELGYIIAEEDFDPSRYEESMSVGPKAAPLIEKGIARMLGRRKQSSKSALLAVGAVATITMSASLAILAQRKRNR